MLTTSQDKEQQELPPSHAICTRATDRRRLEVIRTSEPMAACDLDTFTVHPYFGLAATATTTTAKRIIAPRTIPSNNCLIMILSYTCGREEAQRDCEYNRLCQRARFFFTKPSILNFFNLAPLKIVLNQWTDPVAFFRARIYQLSKKHSLKLTLNVSLASIARILAKTSETSSDESIDSADQSPISNMPSSMSASRASLFEEEERGQVQTLTTLLTAYERVASLNISYQTLLQPFEDQQPCSIQVSRNLLKLKVSNSELDFSIVPFLTQMRGSLRELILTGNTFYNSNIDIVTLSIDGRGDTVISDQSLRDSRISAQTSVKIPTIAANYSIQTLAVYKNNFTSDDIQIRLFSEVIPSLKALKHLTIPSNAFRSSKVARTLEKCITSIESGFSQNLESLNIGNNLWSPADLLSLCTAALASGKLPNLKKLVVAFSDLGQESLDQQAAQEATANPTEIRPRDPSLPYIPELQQLAGSTS